MESISYTKPGIFRRSVGYWKSIYNHKDFVKYTLYTVTGTTVVLGTGILTCFTILTRFLRNMGLFPRTSEEKADCVVNNQSSVFAARRIGKSGSTCSDFPQRR